jgi:hypothetical protein
MPTCSMRSIFLGSTVAPSYSVSWARRRPCPTGGNRVRTHRRRITGEMVQGSVDRMLSAPVAEHLSRGSVWCSPLVGGAKHVADRNRGLARHRLLVHQSVGWAD